jgi:hypothetical protein
MEGEAMKLDKSFSHLFTTTKKENMIDKIERSPFFSHQFEKKKINGIEQCSFVSAAPPQNRTRRIKVCYAAPSGTESKQSEAK